MSMKKLRAFPLKADLIHVSENRLHNDSCLLIDSHPDSRKHLKRLKPILRRLLAVSRMEDNTSGEAQDQDASVTPTLITIELCCERNTKRKQLCYIVGLRNELGMPIIRQDMECGTSRTIRIPRIHCRQERQMMAKKILRCTRKTRKTWQRRLS